MVVAARFAQAVLVVALFFATSGLARAVSVLAADGCCDGCDEPDCPDDVIPDGGCPLPCSHCVCAAHISPVMPCEPSIAVGSSPAPAVQAVAPDVHPQNRLLPGVFRPPRPLA